MISALLYSFVDFDSIELLFIYLHCYGKIDAF